MKIHQNFSLLNLGSTATAGTPKVNLLCFRRSEICPHLDLWQHKQAHTHDFQVDHVVYLTALDSLAVLHRPLVSWWRGVARSQTAPQLVIQYNKNRNTSLSATKIYRNKSKIIHMGTTTLNKIQLRNWKHTNKTGPF